MKSGRKRDTVVLGDFEVALNAGELEKREDARVEHLLRVSLAAMRIDDDANSLHARVVL